MMKGTSKELAAIQGRILWASRMGNMRAVRYWTRMKARWDEIHNRRLVHEGKTD